MNGFLKKTGCRGEQWAPAGDRGELSQCVEIRANLGPEDALAEGTNLNIQGERMCWVGHAWGASRDFYPVHP